LPQQSRYKIISRNNFPALFYDFLGLPGERNQANLDYNEEYDSPEIIHGRFFYFFLSFSRVLRVKGWRNKYYPGCFGIRKRTPGKALAVGEEGLRVLFRGVDVSELCVADLDLLNVYNPP
jgi:hypothetical protein